MVGNEKSSLTLWERSKTAYSTKPLLKELRKPAMRENGNKIRNLKFLLYRFRPLPYYLQEAGTNSDKGRWYKIGVQSETHQGLLTSVGGPRDSNRLRAARGFASMGSIILRRCHATPCIVTIVTRTMIGYHHPPITNCEEAVAVIGKSFVSSILPSQAP